MIDYEVSKIKNNETKWKNQYDNVMSELESELEFLTEEQVGIYYKWWNENNDAQEFNSAKVVEYPFGKSCC